MLQKIIYASLTGTLTNLGLVTAQSSQTFPAPSLYGDVMCTEPQHRFDTSIKQKISHNQDFPSNPEEWICEFCDDNLMKVVKMICCGEAQRKRREAQEMTFWHEASLQSHKLISKPEHHRVFSPDELIQHTISQDCLDDLEGKHRQKRDASSNSNSSGSENSAQTVRWHQSIKNGGKGRSTYDEALAKISCTKPMANDFLKGPSSDKDRKIWKHTYIQNECCDMGDGNGSCEMDEIQSSYLQEECCNEGCRLEEIHEDCGAWRWDMKEYIEEMMG